jgi:hypothetical protein
MQLIKNVLWQTLVWPGSEYCCLWGYDDGWRITGTVLAAIEETPARIQYQVECDPAWHTRLVEIEVEKGAASQTLYLAVDAQQRWRLAEQELTSLAGYLDVDLGFTPATNTLPIRRLNLAVGQSAEVTAVWVQFPSLEIKPLPQRYTRLAQDRYRYESNYGAFVAELEVDQDGLVIHYPGGWQRIAG